MKTFTIEYVQIMNFKGIEDLTIQFDPKETTIKAPNGRCKTSILDAICWCLHGVDSTGRSDFDIKNTKKRELNELEHTVIVVINGTEFKRTLTEDWAGKRGGDLVLKGHKTKFWINGGADILKSSYDVKVAELLAESETFKSLSNPLYFNTDTVKFGWEKRRKVITVLHPVSDNDVAAGNDDFVKLLEFCQSKSKTIDEFKAGLKSEIKDLEAKLKDIKPAITENQNTLSGVSDWSVLEAELKEKNDLLTGVNEKINNKSLSLKEVYEARAAKQQEINEIKSKLNPADLTYKHLEARNLLPQLEYRLKSKGETIASTESKIKGIEANLDDLRKSYEFEASKTFILAPEDTKCPTCEREFENIKAVAGKLENNFNARIDSILSDIETRGIKLKSDLKYENDLLETYKAELVGIESEISATESKIQDLEKQLSSGIDPELKSRLAELEAELSQPVNEGSDDLKEFRTALEAEIKELNEKLLGKTNDEAKLKRIEELKAKQREHTDDIAKKQKSLDVTKAFTKARIDLIEGDINKLFSRVKWRLYETVILTGDEKEICVCEMDGVPFSSLSLAQKVEAGIDCINTLSKHYGMLFPVFIDNRESVISIPDYAGQIVNFKAEGEQVFGGKEIRL